MHSARSNGSLPPEPCPVHCVGQSLGVANRDMGTVLSLGDGNMTLRMDGRSEHIVAFDTAKFRQFDHGYAVTSHSAQGLTTGRVLAHIDTDSCDMNEPYTKDQSYPTETSIAIGSRAYLSDGL